MCDSIFLSICEYVGGTTFAGLLFVSGSLSVCTRLEELTAGMDAGCLEVVLFSLEFGISVMPAFIYQLSIFTHATLWVRGNGCSKPPKQMAAQLHLYCLC